MILLDIRYCEEILVFNEYFFNRELISKCYIFNRRVVVKN
jgi:hypothetical protein